MHNNDSSFSDVKYMRALSHKPCFEMKLTGLVRPPPQDINDNIHNMWYQWPFVSCHIHLTKKLTMFPSFLFVILLRRLLTSLLAGDGEV